MIWGDKKYVLPSLLPEFTGKMNLIYLRGAKEPTSLLRGVLPKREDEEKYPDGDESSPLRFGEGGEERAGRGSISFVKEPRLTTKAESAGRLIAGISAAYTWQTCSEFGIVTWTGKKEKGKLQL